MANIRSSLPVRLRQLISSSSEGAFGPVKLDSEPPPPKIKAYVEKVIECPLPDIAIPLSGFFWEYGKGNFNHWRSLFLHFDTFFRTYLSCRNELLLSDDILCNTSPFPKEAVIQILRVMQIILENCHNKRSFVGLENFRLLLASTDPEIVIAGLECLCALVKISPTKLHKSGRLVGCGSVNSYLLSLAQGWGSKEEGLGLYSCVAQHERTLDDGLCLFPSEVQNDCDRSQYSLGSTLYFELHGSTVSSSASVIHLSDLHLREEDDLSLMKFCIEHYNVPLELRFSLLTRIRYAHALRSSKTCRLYSKICFLAFTVLVQSSDSNSELVSFFANEPEYTNELIRIVRSEETFSGTIRTLAMTALGAQLVAYSASHDRARILTGSIISFAGGNRTILLNVLQRVILSLNNSGDLSSIAFVEALLQFYLIYVISSSSTGSSIRGSGMVPVLLPLLEDSDPTRLHLVCLAVKTLQKLLDYSNMAVTLFRELSGVELLVHRLQTEVHKITDLVGTEDDSTSIGESSRQKRLIKALLKALGSATYTTTNATRSHNSYDVSLTPTLSIIFNNKEKFGGEIYSAAVCLMSEMIHKDPTCFSVLFDLGLPSTFLSSVVAGALPSSKAITSIPHGLGAICLNAKGLEAVRETSTLHFLFDLFTDGKYLIAMNEAVVPLTNALEELLRHVSSLRESGVDVIIKIIEKIASFGDGDATEMNSVVESISNKQRMQLFVFHVMLLIQRILENGESCRLFVEKKGIEVSLRLLLQPSITQSSEGMSLALHSTMIFKCFTQHHSTALARAFCSSLRDHLTKALSGFSIAARSFLLDPKSTPNTEIFSALSFVEFLLLLAASKDSRWVSTLLTEFGNDSRDVLEYIGRIHREVLWQIVLLEDSKVGEPEVGSSRLSELNVNNTENLRLSSSRQFLDPLLRTQMSGLNIDPQVFDLISLYRDLTRSSSGTQRRQVNDATTNQRTGTSQDPQHSASSKGSESLAEKDDGNQRSFYNSCCHTVRSLSIHISYLFQELGKVMLLPSRRRDDMLDVSPASKSVASTFASISMDNMIFLDDLNSADSESSVLKKCRYLGKVIEFIDGVLLVKPDSYNPVLLNCLYGQGVIHSVLTTFQATSLLPFDINRSPLPMETDDKGLGEQEVNNVWIYRTLASYGKLMVHLVTSSLILSPTTKHLIAQPLVSKAIPYPNDPEAFVKNLQSMVLKAVLPVWTHPQFSECGPVFITMIVKVLRQIFSGVQVRNVSSNAARLAGPPPNETTISTIVEMGFSRSRAEEALSQVGTDRVELAMEWLFSHPEEIQEEDELARALAMSLGNSENDTKEEITSVDSEADVEEELVQLPPVDELLSVCRRLLQTKETLAFPVRDLLVMICSQSEGKERPEIISFIIEQVKLCSDVSEHGNENMLSALLHVLALILNEDDVARELASKAGFVKIALDLLMLWSSDTHDQEATEIPKWVTSAFVAIDRLARVDTTLNAELVELLKKNDVGNSPSAVVDTYNSKHLGLHEQKCLIDIACVCIRRQLPSETMHAVLQLCATLTRTHSIAVTLLEAGGLNLLLSLPSTSLFAGFDSVAAIIIRHILEDSHTLQQAMESEIRHIVATTANRQSNGKLTPRNFLSCVCSVAQRDPVVFIQAVRSTCQVEVVGDRQYIVLIKDRDKDKSKEKEKEKLDTNSRNSKIHRKPAQSFVNVIDLLMDSVISFASPHLEDEPTIKIDPSTSDMEIDVSFSKDKGKAIASVVDQDDIKSQESSLSMVKAVFILKLLSEILVMYASSVHILVRRDAEACNYRGTGGIFYHVIHKFLPSKKERKEEKPEVDWHFKLFSRGKQFLVASCVRSSEARKRICTEINSVFNNYVDSSNGVIVPKFDIQALVDVLNDILAARTQVGASISPEVSVIFTEVGLVQSLTRILRFLDLDHADSPKVVNGILKVLELVTREHVHAFESNSRKGEHLVKSTDHSDQPGENDGGSATHANENVIAADQAENVADDMEHDEETGRGFAAAEDEYMQESGEDTQALENGLDTLGIRFEIRSGVQGNVDEDEDDDDDDDEDDNDGDDMSEDEGDEDDVEHNDIEEDGAHGLPHPDTYQGGNEVDEDEFYIEEDEEDDEDGVIVRLGEGMDGVNMFDHIEVFERDIMSNGTFRLMPVNMLGGGSGQLARSTSIYNLLERSGGSPGPSQHPLLVEPPSLRAENGRDPFSLRILESSFPHLESVFGSLQNGLRNGPQENRISMWANELQPSGGPRSPVIDQGLEDFIVSNLRCPPSDISSNTTTQAESQNADGVDASSEFAGVTTEMLTENPPSSEVLNSSRGDDTTPAAYITSDAVRDVEAVSQESGGSGVTLGESLRSLEVGIGSADGHDDGGVRRVNPSFVSNTLVTGRDVPLHSVTEVSEDSNQEADEGGPREEEQTNVVDPIDPAFLDALPDELRAEVLSAPQTQPQNLEMQDNEDIDPEFLAALPPDIREEVLAQQRAQRQPPSVELDGQPVEMDTVSIIATFPSDIREEVLLTSSDAVLASLTPALIAEANMLRERFANRYNQTMSGMHIRNHNGESSRRRDALGRIAGDLSRRSTNIKPVEAVGSPLVDTEGLQALIKLLRVVQPLYKSEQKLLLNLCAYTESRTDLIKNMMDLLLLDKRKYSSDLNALEPSYRLYGCQSNVTYSRPQCLDGLPPLVSRRVLETLTFLARNHPLVAKLLLELRLPQPLLELPPSSADERGKAVMHVDEDMLDNTQHSGHESFSLLLSLLKESLYLRSIAHLEQLLKLLAVIIDNVEEKSNLSDDPSAPESVQPSDPHISTSDTEMNADTAVTSGAGEVDVTMTASSSGATPSSDADKEVNAHKVVNNLPKMELQLICSLLAREGLSDNAYILVAEILRKLVVIAPVHCNLFITQLAESVQSLAKSATLELSTVGDGVNSLLSATSINGAPVLRLVQTLGSLFVSLNEKDKKTDKEHGTSTSLVLDINAALEPLWGELSNCISRIESYSDMVLDPSPSLIKPSTSATPLPAGTHNILPYIESFFVTCEKLHADNYGVNVVSDVDEASTSATQLRSSGAVDEKFIRFSEKHRKVLNAFIRQNPGLIEKSFALMLKVPRFIDFDNKRSHFRSKIKHQNNHNHHSTLRISIRRAYILEDSYNQLRMRSAEELKGRLNVNFQGEEGVDAGGLTREWYQLLSRVIFDKGALLFTTVGNESTFQPNPNSVYQTEHLSYFKFVGRVVGKALFDGQLLDVHFTRSFYKHILEVKVTYQDIEAIDPDYFKNLKWLLENDISDLVDLTFSIDADEEKLILYERAEVTDYELIEGGRNIRVTEENKHQYVDLIAEHRLTTAIRPQINAFMEGFNEMIHRDLISIFNDKELELLISGLPDIDLEDLRVNTEYSGYSPASPAIQWFWEVVQNFSKEDKARLLQFVTGTSKVPLEGFSALQGVSGTQKFQIHKAYGSVDHLPSAHTCFNQLDLPEYPSKERLEERLFLAIHEGSEGFGFG